MKFIISCVIRWKGNLEVSHYYFDLVLFLGLDLYEQCVPSVD